MEQSVEQKFNKNVFWMLNELEEEMISAGKNQINFYYITEEHVPSRREQERVISWLYRLGIAKRLNYINPSDVHSILLSALGTVSPIGERMEIDQQTFIPLRKFYSGDWEKLPASKILKKADGLRQVTKLDTITPVKPPVNNIPFWSSATNELSFLDRSCELPPGNQRVLCKALFSAPLGVWVDEENVIDDFNTQGIGAFYSAYNLLNERIEKELAIEDFVEYQTAKARINPVTIEKLNHSE
jgi:hypothetical protein